jgi:hypothetical protein
MRADGAVIAQSWNRTKDVSQRNVLEAMSGPGSGNRSEADLVGYSTTTLVKLTGKSALGEDAAEVRVEG